MTLTQTQEAPRRCAHVATTAAGIGQVTGALLIPGGVAALAQSHHRCPGRADRAGDGQAASLAREKAGNLSPR
jgi:hypothetical protein